MKCGKKWEEKDLLLYAVTDRSWLNGRTLYSQVEEAIKGGATFIQLREKELNEDAFLEEAKEIKELCALSRAFCDQRQCGNCAGDGCGRCSCGTK